MSRARGVRSSPVKGGLVDYVCSQGSALFAHPLRTRAITSRWSRSARGDAEADGVLDKAKQGVGRPWRPKPSPVVYGRGERCRICGDGAKAIDRL